jgi:hypothetical protein
MVNFEEFYAIDHKFQTIKDMHFTFTLIFHNFLKSWSKYKRFRFIPLVNLNQTPQLVIGWGLGALHHDVVECVL